MTATETTIDVVPGSELDRLLTEADGKVLVLIKDGVRFRVVPDRPTAEAPADESAEPDPWANYDPERAREAMRAAAGSWSDIDADKLIEDIYRWREEGSRSWRKEDLENTGES